MPDLRVLRTAEASPGLLTEVRELLDAAFGDGHSDFSADDWDHCLGGWHVVVVDHGRPVAHAAVVPRTLEIGERSLAVGYVEGVATLPARQGRGLGTDVMRAVGELIGSGFELGALSTSVQAFYERLGWERWRGPAYVRRPTGVERTADEDDGIMVLRHARTPPLELTEAITCAERAGDDW